MDFNKELKKYFSDEEINNILGDEMDKLDFNFNEELKEMGIDMKEIENEFNNYIPKLDLKYSKSLIL